MTPLATVKPSINPARIIGLDASLTAPGWAVYSGLVPGQMLSGVWKPEGKGFHRVMWIRSKVDELVLVPSDGARLPLLMIEGYAFAARGQAAISLGELGGAIRTVLHGHCIYLEVAPTQLKKFITGKGNCDKNLVLKDLYKRFSLDVNDDNEADALGLCILGRALAGRWPAKLNKEQQGIVADLRKQLDARCL